MFKKSLPATYRDKCLPSTRGRYLGFNWVYWVFVSSPYGECPSSSTLRAWSSLDTRRGYGRWMIFASNHCCLCSSFKLFLELEPQVRDIIFKFYESKYASCLKMLDEMKVRSKGLSFLSVYREGAGTAFVWLQFNSFLQCKLNFWPRSRNA